jgi:hypothetical protein
MFMRSTSLGLRDEAHLVFDDLAFFFDPSASHVLQRFARALDALVHGIVKTLVGCGNDFGYFRDAHDRLFAMTATGLYACVRASRLCHNAAIPERICTAEKH